MRPKNSSQEENGVGEDQVEGESRQRLRTEERKKIAVFDSRLGWASC